MRWGNAVYSRRGTILSILGTILLVSFVTTNAITYNGTKNVLQKNLVAEVLPSETDRIAQKIELALMPYVVSSSQLAHDYFIQKWISDGEYDKKIAAEYLENTRKRLGARMCFLASDVSMRYYNSNGNFPMAKTDKDTEWYFKFKNSGKKYELNKTVNIDMNNMPTVFINFRIQDKTDKFLGVVGMGLELAVIPRILNHYKGRNDRNIYFVDAQANIVARSDGALFDGVNMRQLARSENSIKDIFCAKATVFEYEHDGKPILVSTRYIPKLNWWLFVEQEKSSAMRTVNGVMTVNAIIGGCSIVLTMALVFVVVSFFHKKLEMAAATDRLTGINNRLTFERMLERAVSRRSRSAAPFTVLIMDLDFFKLVNDTHGHLEGDNVLKKTVDVVKKVLRTSDEFCRWGGEEFVILAYNCNLDQGLLLAEKIRKTLKSAHVGTLPEGKPVTVSIGVCEARENEDTDRCMDRADKALYKAKEEGRDCVRGG